MLIAEVVYPLPLDRSFDYEVPAALAARVAPGMRVRAPFGPKPAAQGIVLSLREGASEKALKPLSCALDGEPLLADEQLELLRWLSERYCAPLGECLKASVPASLREARRPLAFPPAAAVGPAARVAPRFELTAGQGAALEALGRRLAERRFSATLLFGVPASGKTEVYLRLIRQAVEGGGQALFLVPEISLTRPFFEEFRASVGLPVALWHSQVGAARRKETWLGARSGALRVVVGARSASLLPFKDLRLAVLDEEQDESYKQDDTAPYYHAREVVLRRAERFGASVVLGSATPSVESFARARARGCELLRLDERVARGTARPPVRVLDRPADFGGCLGAELLAAVRDRLQKREQTILVVNRRGFSNFLLCRKCGWVARCPDCSVAWIHHVDAAARRPVPAAAPAPELFAAPAGAPPAGGSFLLCHHCGKRESVPAACGRCRAGALRFAGVGTQKVVAELKARLPGARVLRMDRDSVAAEERQEASAYAEFKAGKADILVGTKLVAKGFHFPNVTLVGIVDADTMLSLPDFRSAERTVQLLVQAAGRAGRAERPGEVLLQTAQPTHYAIQAVARGDYASFAEVELGYRRELSYPPDSTLVRVLFLGTTEKAAAKAAAEAAEALRAAAHAEDEVLGPAPGVHAQLQGRFRFHVLLKVRAAARLPRALAVVRALKLPSTVRAKINVDPYDFL